MTTPVIKTRAQVLLENINLSNPVSESGVLKDTKIEEAITYKNTVTFDAVATVSIVTETVDDVSVETVKVTLVPNDYSGQTVDYSGMQVTIEGDETSSETLKALDGLNFLITTQRY